MRSQTAVLAGAFIAIGLLPGTLHAGAVLQCPSSISAIAERAERILDRPQDAQISEHDRAALVCLARAVRLIDTRLRGLSDGSLPFDGQIHIPKGYVMTKPPASEVR